MCHSVDTGEVVANGILPDNEQVGYDKLQDYVDNPQPQVCVQKLRKQQT